MATLVILAAGIGSRYQGLKQITPVGPNGETIIDSNGDMQTLSGNEIISMNMWAFTPSIFRLFREQFLYFLRDQGKNKKAEFLVPDTINHLIQEGKVRVKVLKQNTCEENNKGGEQERNDEASITVVRTDLSRGYCHCTKKSQGTYR